jgi:hypothetical protein
VAAPRQLDQPRLERREPSTTWPALAAARGDVELINLGLGGNALLDPFTARTLRDTAADLISVKIGINLVNTDLSARAFGPAVHGFLAADAAGDPRRLAREGLTSVANRTGSRPPQCKSGSSRSWSTNPCGCPGAPDWICDTDSDGRFYSGGYAE